MAYTLIDFNGPEPRLVPEAEITTHLLPKMDCHGILDLILPKTRPEFLVSGAAYTAHQQDKTQCAVRVKVADKEKSLLVFGDRYWLDHRISDPQPFEQMPIAWANAFGGAGFDENPEGKGMDRRLINGVWTTPLPNIEIPTQRISSISQRPRPAGFSPVMINRPRRYKHVATLAISGCKRILPAFSPIWIPGCLAPPRPTNAGLTGKVCQSAVRSLCGICIRSNRAGPTRFRTGLRDVL